MKLHPQTVTGPRVALSAVALAFVASSCFDVHQVDPGVLMIDNFDEGAFPSDSTFMPWQCFAFNPSKQQTYSCAYDTDTHDGSKYSLHLDFTVADPMNGVRDRGGVGLVTYAPFGLYQDFTAFATLGFDARVQPGIPVLPITAAINVVLGCSTLADGIAPEDLYVVKNWSFDSGGEWGEGSLSIAEFGPPAVTGLSVTDCLRRVDQVAFQVSPGLADGQSAAGTLNIDDVHLE
jgi:hypothetical protein